MGKKIWLSMHPRNFGSDKIVPRYVRPPLQVRWRNFAFQACRTIWREIAWPAGLK